MGSRAALDTGSIAAWLRRVGIAVVCATSACQGSPAGPKPPPAQQTKAAPAAARGTPQAEEPEPTPAPLARPLRRCFSDVPVWAEAPVADLLDRAQVLLVNDDPAGALACSEEASRQAPRSVEAHYDRAAALLRLGRVDDALTAVTLVLAMAPHDVPAMELAADIFVNHLPPLAERATIGLEYAVRAQKLAARNRDRSARLALLQGQALIDLGRARDALAPLTRAAAAVDATTATSARYERGVALFELARFEEARQQLEAVLALDPDSAHAHYHLGLVFERAGEMGLAEERFARATALDPETFPPLVDVPASTFAERVRQAVAALPAETQASLHDIPVEAAELPALDDLVAEQPPLSPTILGLFRGLPLGQHVAAEAATRTKSGRVGPGRTPAAAPSSAASPAEYVVPERAILLYRRNLLRSVRSEAELTQAISRTLLHEVGHLLGEDDGSLRDRGLE